MLKRYRFLSLALPLALSFSAMSAGVVRADGDEEQEVIIATIKEEAEVAKERAEAEKVEAEKAKTAVLKKAEVVKLNAKAIAELAKKQAEKGKNAAVHEPKLSHPQVLRLMAKAEEAAKEAEAAKKDAPPVTIRGQFKVISPDGKTFEIVAPDGTKVVHEKIAEAHDGKLPRKTQAFTIIRSDGVEQQKIMLDDTHELINKLTARVKDNAVEAPRFLIGVSVSEAPEVVLQQVGKTDAVAVVVDAVVEESPADKAGVKKFDLILKAAGEPVKSPGDLTKIVKSSDGKEIELVLVRTGKELKVNVTPKSNEPVATTATISDGMIQFGPAMMTNRHFINLGQMPGMAPGDLMEEIKSLRKDIEELKKMIEELKATK